jgi:hypothetical protein
MNFELPMAWPGIVAEKPKYQYLQAISQTCTRWLQVNVRANGMDRTSTSFIIPRNICSTMYITVSVQYKLNADDSKVSFHP